jgi:hypothetical protein
MKHKFFFYGTLSHEIEGKVTGSVHQKLTHVGSGYVVGRLFAIPHSEGYYPVFVEDVNGYKIFGNVYEAKSDFNSSDLDTLDEYEEFHVEDLATSEYLRKVASITLAEGDTVDADIYLYNQPLPLTVTEIPCGRFDTFLKERRAEAFGGGLSI